MAKYEANPRSKSMVLEVDKLLRQLGVYDKPPDELKPAAAPAPAAPPQSGPPPKVGSSTRPAAARSSSPSQGTRPPRRESPPVISLASRNASSSPSPTPAERAERAEMWARVALWARVSLCIVLGVAMTQWPYRTACGWALGSYLGAVLAVTLAGGWSALVSWKARSAPAHVISLIVVFWGFVLAAEQSLPRVGYAAEQASWSCRATR